jgi:hypothetical protein
MRNSLLATSILACVGLAGIAVTAQSTGQPPTDKTQTPQERVQKAQELLKARLDAFRRNAPCATVMPTIPADPAHDAAIRKNPPEDTKFTIKAVPPPPCIKK